MIPRFVWKCMRRSAAIAVLLPFFALATASDYTNAKRKLEMIEADRAPRGSQVTFTTQELNAYVAGELPEVAPQGVRNTRLQLGQGFTTGSALIDFLKLREGKGIQTGWFMSKLLSGERAVTVTARIQSASGRATVDVERVEISGVPVNGGALDFLIQNFLLPRFPTAKIGEPFDLEHGVERLDVRPDAVRVVMKK